MATLTTLDSILKEFYLGPIHDQLNKEVLAVELFSKATVDWQGKRAVIPVRTVRNTGVAFLAESATLPTAGSQGYGDLQITARFVYGRFTVTGPSIEAAKSSAGAFVMAMESEMDGLVTDVKNAANNAMFHGGSVIGFVWEKVNQATFEYAGATACADGTAFTLGAAATTGQLVRLDTYATVGAATRINTITESSIVFNAPIDTTAVTAGVVLAVVLPATSTVKYGVAGAWDREPNGIFGNLATTSHFGEDRTDATGASSLQSVFAVVDPATDVYATLTLRSMQRLLDSINDASGKEPDVILCNNVMKVEYTSLLQGVAAANLMVGTDKSQDGHAGFGAIFYNSIPIKSSRHCPKGLFINLSAKASWCLAELGKGSFMDQDGAVLSRVANTDAYEGTYRWYYNLVCKQPGANGILCAVDF